MRQRRLAAMTLMLCALLVPGLEARAQQDSSQVEAEVTRLRQEITNLEQITPPAGRQAQHRGLIQDKRIRLHGLMQQQRDELVNYRDAIARNRAPQTEVQQVEQDIQAKERELEALKALLLGGGGSNGIVATTTPTPTVSPAPTTTSASAAPLPTPASVTPLDAPVAVRSVAAETQAAQGQAALDSCSLLTTPQANQLSEYETAICRLATTIQDEKSFDPAATFTLNLDPKATQTILAAKLIGREERAKFLLAAEEARTDKQVGGGPSNSGSTSLVVKGGAPTVLGFAVENGALVQSRSGTTITFRGNPIGIAKFLKGTGFDESYREDENDPLTRLLKKTSFSVSFDTDRGREPGAFTADPQQISAFTARYEFINERDPRHRKHQSSWERFLADEGVALTRAVAATHDALVLPPVSGTDAAGRLILVQRARFKDPVLQAWLDETQRLIGAAGAGNVESILKSQLDKFPAPDKLFPETRAALDDFTNTFGVYLSAREKLLKEIAKGSVITFEYTNKREVNAPDTSNFRFIAEKGIFNGRVDLTANAALTMFHTRPAAGAKRLRDFQFAAQIDVPFKLQQFRGFVFSAAGKYERALEGVTALDGTFLPDLKGDIAVGQLKLTIPFLEGVQFPISMTFANRSELVREKDVRGNFGFTFDLDKIFAKYNPF